jgi:predicted PurR-regulated permease PerM
MKLTGAHGTFMAMLLIAVISASCALVPVFGGVLSAIVMFVLISKWTDANFWPDAVLLVVVAWLVEMTAGLAIAKVVVGV